MWSSPGKEPIWEAATMESLVAFSSFFVKGIISAIMSQEGPRKHDARGTRE